AGLLRPVRLRQPEGHLAVSARYWLIDEDGHGHLVDELDHDAAEGGVAALAHRIGGVHPYKLRQAIASGVVEARFVGGGRFAIGASEVERIREQGLVRAGNDDEGERPLMLSPRSD